VTIGDRGTVKAMTRIPLPAAVSGWSLRTRPVEKESVVDG
jgi:hypothetical protein